MALLLLYWLLQVALPLQERFSHEAPVPVHASSRQTPAKPQYSWHPTSPGMQCCCTPPPCYSLCGISHSSEAAAGQTHTNTTWSSLSQSHRAEAASKSQPQAQQDVQTVPGTPQAPTLAGLNTVQGHESLSGTAGWFIGAAGQLAASTCSGASASNLSGPFRRQQRYEGKPNNLLIFKPKHYQPLGHSPCDLHAYSNQYLQHHGANDIPSVFLLSII